MRCISFLACFDIHLSSHLSHARKTRNSERRRDARWARRPSRQKKRCRRSPARTPPPASKRWGVPVFSRVHVHFSIVHALLVERETARFLSVPVLMSHVCVLLCISTRSVSGVLSWVLTPAPFSHSTHPVMSSQVHSMSQCSQFIHRPTTATYHTFLCR